MTWFVKNLLDIFSHETQWNDHKCSNGNNEVSSGWYVPLTITQVACLCIHVKLR